MIKPLHLLIDGPDSVGKTTVCGYLKEAIGIPVTHMEKAKEVFNTTKTCDIELLSYVYNQTLLQLKDHDFIVDRGFVSTLVYSMVYERNPRDLDYIDDLEKALSPEVYILINNNDEVLEQRGDEVVPVADFDYIRSTYQSVAKGRGYTVIDVTEKESVQVFTEIILSLVSRGCLPLNPRYICGKEA